MLSTELHSFLLFIVTSSDLKKTFKKIYALNYQKIDSNKHLFPKSTKKNKLFSKFSI